MVRERKFVFHIYDFGVVFGVRYFFLSSFFGGEIEMKKPPTDEKVMAEELAKIKRRLKELGKSAQKEGRHE